MSAQITNNMKTYRVKPDNSGWTVAAGTTDTLESTYVDTAGFQGCRFIIGFGAITANAVTTCKVEQCDTSGGSYADLLGTAISVADDDDSQIVVMDIFQPRERYLKSVITRATANAVVDFLIVELYGPTTVPAVRTDATVVATEISIAPAEGTA